jgi:phosphoinositide-3-kinase regulatory subunit 4
VGHASLQAFVLPCILQGGLYDVEESVVAAAVAALCRLAAVSLDTQNSLLEIGGKVAPLVAHPSSWIRHLAAQFFVSIR